MRNFPRSGLTAPDSIDSSSASNSSNLRLVARTLSFLRFLAITPVSPRACGVTLYLFVKSLARKLSIPTTPRRKKTCILRRRKKRSYLTGRSRNISPAPLLSLRPSDVRNGYSPIPCYPG
eukprot:scaffold86463_cov78-Phaeocystis_antarctica.AAC.3